MPQFWNLTRAWEVRLCCVGSGAYGVIDIARVGTGSVGRASSLFLPAVVLRVNELAVLLGEARELSAHSVNDFIPTEQREDGIDRGRLRLARDHDAQRHGDLRHLQLVLGDH